MVMTAALVSALIGLLLTAGTPWAIPVVALFALFAVFGAKVMLNVRAGRRRARFADQLDESTGAPRGRAQSRPQPAACLGRGFPRDGSTNG
jgi:hypothetical protein